MRNHLIGLLCLLAAGAWAADCSRTSVGLTPLNAPFQRPGGGLYPDGNQRPAAHEATGVRLAREIAAGTGPVVFLSIGMSNTTQEFSVFKTLASADAEVSPRLVIVDGAQGGWSADRIVANPDDYWRGVDTRLAAAKATPGQVRAAWLKEADARPTLPFPEDARKLQAELRTIVLSLRARFPNLAIVFLSSRIYGGYASTPLNPEPYAYQSGYAVKWLIEQQVNGDAELRNAPWLSWGPYLWADGTKARFDGLTWNCEDLGPDGTHPSVSGRRKVAGMLLDFLKADPAARPWFVRPAATNPPPKPTALRNAAGWFEAVAPGSVAALFGTDLAGGTAQASALPLPPGLVGTRVLVGGQTAPLYYTSPGQINLLVPADPADSNVIVEREGVRSAPLTAMLRPDSPGLFQTAVPASVPRGDVVQLFGTGRGMRNPMILRPEFLPAVTVGGAPAEVTYWGVSPCCPGLDQLNVRVPASAPAGDTVPVEMRLGTFQANPIAIAVE